MVSGANSYPWAFKPSIMPGSASAGVFMACTVMHQHYLFIHVTASCQGVSLYISCRYPGPYCILCRNIPVVIYIASSYHLAYDLPVYSCVKIIYGSSRKSEQLRFYSCNFLYVVRDLAEIFQKTVNRLIYLFIIMGIAVGCNGMSLIYYTLIQLVCFFEPLCMVKKVPFIPYFFSISRTCGVTVSSGPSSKVRYAVFF